MFVNSKRLSPLVRRCQGQYNRMALLIRGLCVGKVQLITLLLMMSWGVVAQDDCADKLKSAEELYEMGQIDKVEPLLNDCLINGFSKVEKVKAYRLLTLCYLYYNEQEKASGSMGQLLKVDPEYKISRSNDPSEFILLHDQFRTKPLVLLGFKAGGGMLGFYDIINYNDINSLHPNSSYQANVSWISGVTLEIPIYNSFALNVECLYNSYSYTYARKGVLGYSNIEMTERLGVMQLPLLVQYNHMKNDFTPYVNAGITFSYLLSSEADFKRVDVQDIVKGEPIVGTLNLASSRNRENFALTGSIGFRWKNILGRGYVGAEIRYVRNLFPHVDEVKRAENQEMVYYFLTTDNNMKHHQTYFLASYRLPIYLAKQKRKKRH